jgi:sigma-B regulation protein RsbU (phosphoserine phosphatase)
MAAISDQFLRTQLEQRRQRLETAIALSPENPPLVRLLEEVDSALQRMEKGTYGLCESCHDTIERDRLIADPLIRYCLDHLTAEQQRALEQDLELAARIQRALLPRQDLRVGDWQVHYHYQPAGPVSGDYCDLIDSDGEAGALLFLLGDVSGKGVAASLLMSQLHAMFRSLASVGLPLDQLVALANRVFCESTIAGQFATLVCGRAGRAGEVEICNAGHYPTLLVHNGEVSPIEATGLPLGMFSNGEFPVQTVKLSPGDTLFLHTDGLSEMRDPSSAEYGLGRLAKFVGEQHTLAPPALTSACLQDVRAFSAGAPSVDDLTIMVLQRAARAAAKP